MKKYVEVDLSSRGLRELSNNLRDYQKWLERKSNELAKRLADMGATKTEINFDAAYYDGDEDHAITVEPIDGGYSVKASGRTVLFVEFGTGLIGYGHPELHGMGPGTYPGKGHWNDPNGWWYAHGQHSHGNPPNMPMYNTVKELEMELERVVKEVFAL